MTKIINHWSGYKLGTDMISWEIGKSEKQNVLLMICGVVTKLLHSTFRIFHKLIILLKTNAL